MKLNKIQDTEKKFVQLVGEYSICDITESNFRKHDLFFDCGYDSIQMIELICSVEELFNIRIADEFLLAENIRQLGKFFDYIWYQIELKNEEKRNEK